MSGVLRVFVEGLVSDQMSSVIPVKALVFSPRADTEAECIVELGMAHTRDFLVASPVPGLLFQEGLTHSLVERVQENFMHKGIRLPHKASDPPGLGREKRARPGLVSFDVWPHVMLDLLVFLRGQDVLDYATARQFDCSHNLHN